MVPRLARTLLLGTACTVALPLVGCVVAPAPYYGDVVNVAPPPPQVEYYGAPPAVGWVWIGGYWGWAGDRHVWRGGHWEAPRPGYRWTPHAWVPEARGWRFRPGYWGR